ncbi:hypothetical protein ACLHDD_12860 [Pantoea sp. NSTU24]
MVKKAVLGAGLPGESIKRGVLAVKMCRHFTATRNASYKKPLQ